MGFHVRIYLDLARLSQALPRGYLVTLRLFDPDI